MFVERLSEEDYKEMFVYIFKKGFNFSQFVFNNSYTFVDEVAEQYALKYSDGEMYVCTTFKTADSSRGKRIYLNGQIVYMGAFNFYESYNAKNSYYAKDFAISYDSEQDSIRDVCMINDLNKAYLSYMYSKFGEEYKNAYLTYRDNKKGDVIKKYDAETVSAIKEMCK